MALKSLKHADYSDLELLMILEDLGDNEGWSSTEEIARRLGISEKMGNRCVGSRFAWMRRWGWVERDEKRRWRNTDAGLELVQGQLSPATAKLIDSLEPGDRVVATRRMTEGPVNRTTAQMMKREFKRNMYLTRP